MKFLNWFTVILGGAGIVLHIGGWVIGRGEPASHIIWIFILGLFVGLALGRISDRKRTGASNG